ncbi:hypothetical protein BJ742DRAFT_791097 [Cladochytrium replicatum]|nr:hypothetical protein BJ742DRAFT_791097 [Cladochytrium replicatum]
MDSSHSFVPAYSPHNHPPPPLPPESHQLQNLARSGDSGAPPAYSEEPLPPPKPIQESSPVRRLVRTHSWALYALGTVLLITVGFLGIYFGIVRPQRDAAESADEPFNATVYLASFDSAGFTNLRSTAFNAPDFWKIATRRFGRTALVNVSTGPASAVIFGGDVTMMEGIFLGSDLPNAWTVGTAASVDQIDDYYRNWRDTTFFGPSPDCVSVMKSPLGIVMWRPFAEALGWPNASIGWTDIARLAVNGWQTERFHGPFLFGLGNPEISSSGRLALLSMVYAATGVHDVIQDSQVGADAARLIGSIASSVQYMGAVDADAVSLMKIRGMMYLHAYVTYEANVAMLNEDLRSQFAFIYPANGTFWLDHPICIVPKGLDPRHRSAETDAIYQFRNFTLTDATQRLAVANGYRPTFQNISLDEVPGSPFSNQSSGTLKGVTESTIRPYAMPSASTVNKTVELWNRVKKPKVTLFLIENSSAMDSLNGILDAIKSAVQKFITLSPPHDFVLLGIFDDDYELLAPQPLTDTTPTHISDLTPFSLSTTYLTTSLSLLSNLPTTSTPTSCIHDALVYGHNLLTTIQTEEPDDVARNYHVVVFSASNDTASTRYPSPEDFSNALPPFWASSASQVHVSVFQWGSGTKSDEIVNATVRTGGKYVRSAAKGYLSESVWLTGNVF